MPSQASTYTTVKPLHYSLSLPVQRMPHVTLISIKSGTPFDTSDAYASSSSVFHSFTRVSLYTVLWRWWITDHKLHYSRMKFSSPFQRGPQDYIPMNRGQKSLNRGRSIVLRLSFVLASTLTYSWVTGTRLLEGCTGWWDNDCDNGRYFLEL